MSEEREAIVVPPLSRDDNSLKDASGASVNITANPAQEDPFAGMNIEEFKSRAARVLDRTFSVDRLRVELPPHLWGEWVPDNAIDMAKMEITDPYSFFVDMGLSDPEGRTERLILAKTDPTAYLQHVVKGIDSSKALAQALMNAEIPSPPNSTQAPNPVSMPGGQPAGAPVAQPGQAPQNPSPTNTGNVPAQPPANPPGASPRVL